MRHGRMDGSWARDWCSSQPVSSRWQAPWTDGRVVRGVEAAEAIDCYHLKVGVGGQEAVVATAYKLTIQLQCMPFHTAVTHNLLYFRSYNHL